ncbi:hypothetical protein JCM9279_003407 [Rhodotorula babjevae]
MPRRRRSSYEHGPELDSAASLASPQHASRRSTRDGSNPLGPPPRPPQVDRRPSPHTFVSEPPRLHVRKTLSAEAATRLMLEKWDLMDEAVVEHEREGRRGRRRGGRSSSVPSRGDRTVEMERREDEAKARVELAEVQAQQQQQVVVDEPVVERKKVRDRKATPRIVVTAPVSDNDDDEWRSSGRRSATTSMASTGSSPPLLDDLGEARWSSQEEVRRRGELVMDEADLGSPGKSPSPPYDPHSSSTGAAAAELVDAGLAVVEHVGEAVSSALSRVGALFSSSRT